MPRTTRTIAAALAVAGTLVCAVAPASAATTSQRLAKLEKAQKATAKTDKAQKAELATLRRDLAATRTTLTTTQNRVATAERRLDAVATLLLNCFGSTSFDLDAATSYFDGLPFITTSLNSTAAGPFYLATVAPSCVGAITPPITAAATSKARTAPTMFPDAHLPLPAIR